MDGNATIVCDKNGEWSNSPTCYRICKEDPPKTPNAILTLTGRRVNDTIVYSCVDGFEVNGTDTGMFIILLVNTTFTFIFKLFGSQKVKTESYDPIYLIRTLIF